MQLQRWEMPDYRILSSINIISLLFSKNRNLCPRTWLIFVLIAVKNISWFFLAWGKGRVSEPSCQLRGWSESNISRKKWKSHFPISLMWMKWVRNRLWHISAIKQPRTALVNVQMVVFADHRIWKQVSFELFVRGIFF